MEWKKKERNIKYMYEFTNIQKERKQMTLLTSAVNVNGVLE